MQPRPTNIKVRTWIASLGVWVVSRGFLCSLYLGALHGKTCWLTKHQAQTRRHVERLHQGCSSHQRDTGSRGCRRHAGSFGIVKTLGGSRAPARCIKSSNSHRFAGSDPQPSLKAQSTDNLLNLSAPISHHVSRQHPRGSLGPRLHH